MFAFDNNTTPSSQLHQYHLPNPNPPPFFSNFPSPFFDEHELPLHQTLVPDPIDKTSKRKRTAGKKDRHSKICTANGIRDRRMRLSLNVARKFFDIQDMLGYDKASATIEWLFSKSKQAIRELVEAKRKNKNNHVWFDFSGDSFSSECEVVSGVAHEATSSEKNELGQVLAKKTRKNTRSRPKESVRELREKARARARWRTKEKMMVKQHESEPSLEWANSDQKLGFSFSNDEELSGSYQTPSMFLSQDLDTGTIEKLLGKSSFANQVPPISSDNYGCCIDLMGFMGDWEMLSSVTNQEGVVSSSLLAAAGNNSNDI